MREIKFRALKDDMSNCNFVYGNLIYDTDGVTPRIQTGNGFSFSTCIKGTEGQFTGLKDKNGVDIYEGDVCVLVNIKEYISSKHMSGTRRVLWSEENLCLWFSGCVPLVWGGHQSIEVIGNIHQNPELLCK